MRHYGKEIPESAVWINGVPLKFEILETADPTTIAELDKCIAHGRGGVYSITEEQYAEELKKKESGISSSSSSMQPRSRQELSALHFPQRPVAVDGAHVDFGGTFARFQDREQKPHNQHGLPGGSIGPAGNSSTARPMPDPIEIPKPSELKPNRPPTAKLSEIAAP